MKAEFKFLQVAIVPKPRRPQERNQLTQRRPLEDLQTRTVTREKLRDRLP